MRNPNATIQRCPTCCGFHGNRHPCPDGDPWPPLSNVTQLRPPRSLPGSGEVPERPDPRAVVAFLVFAVVIGALVGTAGAAWFTRRSR